MVPMLVQYVPSASRSGNDDMLECVGGMGGDQPNEAWSGCPLAALHILARGRRLIGWILRCNFSSAFNQWAIVLC